MTFVGKVLVVVQLVLSICFMAFAGAVYTYQKNWKAEYEATKTKLDESQAKLGDAMGLAATREGNARKTLEQHRIPFSAEADIVAEAMAKFTDQVERNATLESDLQTAKDELTVARDRETKANRGRLVAIETSRLATESYEARLKEATALRGLNLTAQADLQVKERELRNTEDVKFSLTRDVDELSRRYNDKITENARLRQLLLLNDLNPDAQPETNDAPPPAVEGLVLKTKKTRSTELIEISIGSDDGLQEGDSLFVYNRDGGKYLGRIRIVYITPDRAVGSVTERAKNGTIAEGDNVSTKL